MSTDPYHAVQAEVQASLQNAATLRASYMRIRSTAREDSEELIWARNEVRGIWLCCRGLKTENELIRVRWIAESHACGAGGGLGGFGGECEVSRERVPCETFVLKWPG